MRYPPQEIEFGFLISLELQEMPLVDEALKRTCIERGHIGPVINPYAHAITRFMRMPENV